MKEYKIRGRFSPSASLLGKTISKFESDPIRSESIYLASATFAAIAIILLLFSTAEGLQWSSSGLLSPLELSSLTIICYATFVGFKTSIHIRWDGNRLDVNSGKRTVSLSEKDVVSVRIMDGTEYHRTLRRYTNNVEFTNSVLPTVLIVELTSYTLSLGVPQSSQQELKQSIAEACGIEMSEQAPIAI